MALKTKKVYDYRGHRVFLRQLGRNVFEFITPSGKDLYEHSFEIQYAKRQKQFSEEEFKEIYDMMRDVANNFIDVKIYQRSFKAKINNLIFNAKRNWSKLHRTPAALQEVQRQNSSKADGS